MITLRSEWRPCVIPEGWQLSHLHVPRIDWAGRHTLLKYQGRLLLFPVVDLAWWFTLLFSLTCHIFWHVVLDLCSQLFQCLCCQRVCDCEDFREHETSYVTWTKLTVLALFFHCSGCLEFFWELPLFGGLVVPFGSICSVRGARPL